MCVCVFKTLDSIHVFVYTRLFDSVQSAHMAKTRKHKDKRHKDKRAQRQENTLERPTCVSITCVFTAGVSTTCVCTTCVSTRAIDPIKSVGRTIVRVSPSNARLEQALLAGKRLRCGCPVWFADEASREHRDVVLVGGQGEDEGMMSPPFSPRILEAKILKSILSFDYCDFMW